MARTLTEARRVATSERYNSKPWLGEGKMEPGTEVVILQKNDYGHYVPCVAFIRHVTKTGRVAVDLWSDKSVRTTVSHDAVLWRPAA
jgi:hypothetical protein